MAADGTGRVQIDFADAPRGPLTVVLAGAGGSSGPATTRLQLYNASGPAAAEVLPPSDLATGRTLVYDEEFEHPLSISRDGLGADYAAAKPNRSGAEDFGDAIFPDPRLGFDNLQVVDEQYLRIKVEPNPPGFEDPNPWNRSRVGGLLASARTGGSGFSAQYGYFEARMLAPVAPGTWPAFWTLPAPNLAVAQPVEAEVDAVELYGNDPLQTCHSTHQHQGGEDEPNTQCEQIFRSAEAALGWHVYGVDVTPTGITFFVDGKQVATAPQITGGDQPMFFMVNLALGGGWPVELDNVGNRAALYVDYVRVYT